MRILSYFITLFLIVFGVAERGFSRIINGDEVPEGRFPYYVSLYKNGFVDSSNFICGGSLVAPDMVLSAAHCGKHNSNIQVTVGSNKVDGSGGGTIVNITENIIHKEFSRQNIKSDIMLLRLETAVFTQTPVTLNFYKNIPSIGQDLVAMGLGISDLSDPYDLKPADNLQYATLPEFPYSECKAEYDRPVDGLPENFFAGIEADKHICFGGEEKDTCLGDSGSPLVILSDKSVRGSVDIQVGISSFGKGCALKNVPSVFARVSGWEDWIKEQMCEKSKYPPDFCNSRKGLEVLLPPINSNTSFCFSSVDTVEIENIGTVPMKNVKIGDSILVAKPDKYEQIYSFGHHSDSIKTEFLSIITTNGATLEVTRDHLVFLEGGISIPAWALLRQQKKVRLIHHDDGFVGIQSIDTIIREGVYAPFTPSGTLIVNGFQVSSFVAINGSATITILGGINLHYQMISKLFESPHRLVCRVANCQKESYNQDNGISAWHAVALEAYQWLLRQNIVIFHLGFLLSLALVGLVAVCEFVLPYFILLSLLIALSMNIIILKQYSINSSVKTTN